MKGSDKTGRGRGSLSKKKTYPQSVSITQFKFIYTDKAFSLWDLVIDQDKLLQPKQKWSY